MLAEVLQARLQVLEEEVLRLTKLAAQAPDQVQQDNYCRLAQDLQREARELRSEIRKCQNPQLLEQDDSPKEKAFVCEGF